MKFEIYQKLYKRRFSWSFGVQMAEVAVEVETGRVKVLKVTAVNDLGTVIEPADRGGTDRGGYPDGPGLCLDGGILKIAVCFEFRASNFGFSLNRPRLLA